MVQKFGVFPSSPFREKAFYVIDLWSDADVIVCLSVLSRLQSECASHGLTKSIKTNLSPPGLTMEIMAEKLKNCLLFKPGTQSVFWYYSMSRKHNALQHS